MARTVDPARHQARRLQIVDAAFTCIADVGFQRTTTAAICRRAGIGSGTFFHYFPTKLSVLLAVLELSTTDSQLWFEAQQGRSDPMAVVLDYAGRTADEAADPRVPGFVRAVGGLVGEPEVDAALACDEAVMHDGLEPWVAAAQSAGLARTDQSAARLTSWLVLLFDGFLGRLASARGFDAAAERAMLLDAVQRLLAPGPS